MQLLKDCKTPHATTDHTSSTSYTKMVVLLGSSDAKELAHALANSSVWSVVVDESTAIDSTGMCAVIITCCCAETGKVTEHVAGLKDLKGDQSGLSITKAIMHVLQNDCKLSLGQIGKAWVRRLVAQAAQIVRLSAKQACAELSL